MVLELLINLISLNFTFREVFSASSTKLFLEIIFCYKNGAKSSIVWSSTVSKTEIVAFMDYIFTCKPACGSHWMKIYIC